MIFSDVFGVTRAEDDDWFDVVLPVDTLLFVDPFLVFQENEDEGHWKGAHDDLAKHFQTCFELVARGHDNPASLPYGKAVRALTFKEPREFVLGYSDESERGSGGGPGIARSIAAGMNEAITRGLGDLRHFEELGVLNRNIGPDRISDFTLTVLKSRFIEYTQDVARRHDIPMESHVIQSASFSAVRQAWQHETVELPTNPFTKLGVLLVPERFLRELPSLNAKDWYSYYENTVAVRDDLNYDLLEKVDKTGIVEMARRHPEMVREWAEDREARPVDPYPVADDPKMYWKWAKVAVERAKSNPLGVEQPTDQESLEAAILAVIEDFKHWVEKAGGWKNFWYRPRPRADREFIGESASQRIFMGIARAHCMHLEIMADREIDLGVGTVDFSFATGINARLLIEAKKLTHGRFWDGLEKQLPAYLDAQGTTNGWLMVIVDSESKPMVERRKQLPGRVDALSQAREDLSIDFVEVDVLPRESASKQ